MVFSTRGLVLGATALLGAGAVVTGAGLHLSSSWAVFRDSPKEVIDQVWQVINQEYVDGTFNGVDWRAVRTQYLNRNYASTDEAYTAVREMVDKLGDPYTRFMDPGQFQSMRIDTSGELTGVGIQISQDEETKKITVISPIEGSPASDAGIRAQDIILEVDGQSTEGMDINQVVSLIRGPVNSNVVLTISRGTQELSYTLKRARIELHPVRFSQKSSPMGDIGYIRLTQFNSNAETEMRNAIRELDSQDVAGFILDLRFNPGGLLDSSAKIARMWMDHGDIVSTIDRQGVEVRMSAERRGKLTDKPLVVLVDGGSASASEILAGALQDNNRAVLVGTKTFGKGLVQMVHPLRDGSGLAVTIAKYYTPSGRDINKKGIEPDITVELTEEQQEKLTRDTVGTQEDPQYLRALSALNEQITAQRSQIQSSAPEQGVSN
ncbi:PDZ domain-containing protein [Synechococcales cyanobacterium C]|uniref:C-terminal processing peptidase n=1 Tax=Petrachloros mirabilis ULC683 TaxID=2781853 RepID=A0A8K1ZZ58_9CYAN|nr:carboxyl-terminal processing protease CtpC [Petrachloros mirabilis]NCJ06367.1 PDZ domain-containing protein [Petrachloros mirabilis ULC683]